VTLALAHRGDWSAAPENTLGAFAAAERAGADMIELDVRRTADGGVAVLHDPTLERIWGLPQPLAELTQAEVRELRFEGHGIPSLGEVLAAVRVPVMVDYTLADVVEPALETIVEADALERVLFAGGNVAGHRRIRALAPEARIALTWTRSDPPADELLEELQIEYFNPPWELVSAPLVESMHERGLLVSTWTVDDPATMRTMLDLQVDALISNCIGVLADVLGHAADPGQA
jgi:glycerophosphoryl diester phosphodiesterase